MMQIPEGSLPILSLDYLKTRTMQIKSYASRTTSFYFYFPSTG